LYVCVGVIICAVNNSEDSSFMSSYHCRWRQ